MITQKRPVSLIELLIAIVLTIAILMTLTFFYRQVTEIGYEVERVGVKNFNMRYIESRLAAILPKIIGETHGKKDFLFFSVGDEGITKPGSQSLIFTFDNGVSLDKDFAGHVLARLYLDSAGNLMIAYWPSPKRWENDEKPPLKKEMLLQGVDNMSFEFYIAPLRKELEETIPRSSTSQNNKNDSNKDDKKEQPQEAPKQTNKNNSLKKEQPEPAGDWRKQFWLQDYMQLPVMLKIVVTMQKETSPHIFIYPLANAKSHVVYE